MNGRSEYYIFIGIRETGKSRAMSKFENKDDRRLYIPPNRAEDTWHAKQLINTYSILESVTAGRFWDFESFYKSSHREVFDMQRKFMYALSEELRFEKGERRIYIDHPEIRDIICSRIPLNPKGNDKIPIGFSHGQTFFDDFKDYIKSNVELASVRNFISSGRHFWTDIYFATHGPNNVPPYFLDFEPKIYLFRTSGNFQNTGEKFTRRAELLEMQQRVNNITDKTRKGYKPEDQYYCEIFK